MTVMMHDFEESVYRVGRSYLTMMKSTGTGWREGIYNSTHGLVRVFESYTPKHSVTAMFFIYEGHSYQRRWETTWGDKTIARLARVFVEETIADPVLA